MTNIKITHEAILQQLSVAFTTIPFNQMLGLKIDHIEDAHVMMSFSMKNDLIGNYLHGILHGGVISSVLDMAGGILAMASVANKLGSNDIEAMTTAVGKCSTIDLHVSYISPGKGDRFIAKAHMIKSGNKIGFTRMELFNQDDTLIATANGTYSIG